MKHEKIYLSPFTKATLARTARRVANTKKQSDRVHKAADAAGEYRAATSLNYLRGYLESVAAHQDSVSPIAVLEVLANWLERQAGNKAWVELNQVREGRGPSWPGGTPEFITTNK